MRHYVPPLRGGGSGGHGGKKSDQINFISKMIFLLEPSPIIALSCQSASPLVKFVAFIKFTQSPLVLAIIKSVSFQELIEFKEVNAC